MIVASYNLDSLDDSADDPRDFGARVATLRQKLRALNADVLRLREIQGQESSGPSAIHLRRPMRSNHLLASPALAARHCRSALMKRDLPDDTQAGPADPPHAQILAEFDLG